MKRRTFINIQTNTIQQQKTPVFPIIINNKRIKIYRNMYMYWY